MTEPSNEPAAGIDQQLGSGVAESDLNATENPEEGRGRGTLRTDPDDPKAGMQAASEESGEDKSD